MPRKTQPARPPVLPETRTGAAIDRFGPPSVLKPHVLPMPEVGSREVLIQMYAAGVGVWDAEAREGSWRPWGKNPEFPLVIGTDGAGLVAAKGSAVRRFAPGDRVWAFHIANPKGGFYAEYVAVDAACVGHVPQLVDWTQAGAGAVTGLTALQGIDRELRLKPGETLLVLGASGRSARSLCSSRRRAERAFSAPRAVPTRSGWCAASARTSCSTRVAKPSSIS